jgi:WD40 repeat protein
MRQGRIRTLLTDVERLLLAYKMPIIVGALHVYWSALVTMPSCLLWEETAPHDGHGIPMLVTQRALGWGVRETVLEAEDTSNVNCLAYSPNSKLIVSVLLNGGLRVWDLATGTALHTISVYDTDPEATSANSLHTSVAFSPNGQWIVSGGTDCTARLWDVVTGSQHRVMNGHANVVGCVAFSPDSMVIASSDDSTLRIWDVGTGAERLVVTGHTRHVTSLAFAPHGQTIVSASADGTLRVWDVLTGTELHVMKGGGELHCVAFSPDGATIASGGHGVAIQLWSAADTARQHALQDQIYGVCSLAFSPDSRSIVSCDGSGLARIWDVTTGIEKRRLRENVAAVTYSPDGKSIAMVLRTGTIQIWDANTNVAAHPIPEDHQAQIKSATFSPDGSLIASRSNDLKVRVWDAITGMKRHVMDVGNAVRSIAFSSDNRTIACGQHNGIVQLWDVASGLKQSSMMGRHASMVVSVAFSSDGKSVVSYSAMDGIARVWDAATGAEQHILTYPVARSGIDSTIRPVAFSADGKAIIVRESNSSRVVEGFWDLTTTQLEYTESTSSHERTPALDDFHTSEQHYFEGTNSAWIRHCVGQDEMACVCWLPQERRGSFAYSGTRVCTGGRDGTSITILDFSHVGLLQQVV